MYLYKIPLDPDGEPAYRHENYRCYAKWKTPEYLFVARQKPQRQWDRSDVAVCCDRLSREEVDSRLREVTRQR